MKRILISTTFDERIMPLRDAFFDLGWEADVFRCTVESKIEKYLFKPLNKTLRNLSINRDNPVGRNSRWHHEKLRERLFEEKVIAFRPDLILIQRGHGYKKEFLDRMRKDYGVKRVVGWWTKGSKWFDLAISESNCYDFYFFINRDFVKMGKELGMDNWFYLPHAVNSKIYRKIDDNTDEHNDIVFVGNWSPARQKVVEAIIDFNLKIWGRGWKRRNIFNKVRSLIVSESIIGDDTARLYSSSKIVLNISAMFGSSSYWLNQRVFDVPACDSFLLTDYSEQLSEFFEVGSEIETYRSIEELRDKIGFYLIHDELRKKIARAGFEKIKKIGTLKDRMKEILSVIGEYEYRQ